MNDNLISRAAAIDALKEAFNPSITNFVKAKMAIDNLPPAQSEVRTQMSSADCISRQSAIDRINKQREHLQPDIYPQDKIGDAAYRICAEFIERLPSAQPERETAKFIRWMECKKTVNYISYTPHCKCSKCGTEFLIETIKYCYMCGARMER